MHCVAIEQRLVFTQTEECSSPGPPSESSKEEGAKRIRGAKAHHDETDIMDPQSARHIVL